MKEKEQILLPVWGVGARVFLAWITIYLPKVVLDLLEQKTSVITLLVCLVMGGVLLAVASINNAVVHNMLEEYSQTYLYRHQIRLWEQKVIRMDYELFTSPQGKLLAEKARNVVSSPNWGVVAYLPRLTLLLENAAGLLTFGAIIGGLNPWIFVFLLALFGMEMILTVKTEKKKHTLQLKQAVVNRKLNYLAYGTRGMQEGKDIRIYGMIPWLQAIKKEVLGQKDALEKEIMDAQKKRLLLTGLLILLRDGSAYGYLIYCFLCGEMHIGDFVLYFAAITGLGNWLTGLVESIGQFLEAVHWRADFNQFMKLEHKDVAVGEKEPTSSDAVEAPITFSFEKVSYSYPVISQGKDTEDGEVTVLKNIDLTIAAGEKIAIVGVNGAGKTTLVKLLCGMLTPTSGRILVNGVDSRSFSKETYFGLFSAVFQNAKVLPVSIAENIMLNIREEGDRDVMWECIRMSGLEKKVNSLPQREETCLVKRIAEQGTELSGGEVQRLLLARALYKDAPVLVLDEPTAALDPLAERELYEKYHQLTQGKTAVFISHRLASTRFCHRILLLEQGQIVEMGTHEELMRLGGRYAEMFRVQSHYYGAEGEVACS